MGAYNLHFIKTDKFKTISIDINFYRKIKEDEVTKRNLLKMILLDSNNDYKTELCEDLISIIHRYSNKLYSNRRKELKEIEKILKNE